MPALTSTNDNGLQGNKPGSEKSNQGLSTQQLCAFPTKAKQVKPLKTTYHWQVFDSQDRLHLLTIASHLKGSAYDGVRS
jgi:hypothetical protein